MNEIIRPDEVRAEAQSSTVDLRSYCDHASKMRESAEIARIAPALVRAQAALENPTRNRSVQVRTQAGSYQFRYATLDRILDMVRPALAENGLCVLQPIISTERGPALLTRLLHESGQWMECEIPLPPLGQNPQGFGSAVTYMRRYSITALLNISADEDDDANRAAGNHIQDLPNRKGASARAGREAAAEPRDPADELRDPAARLLVERARVAESVEDGQELLEEWLRQAESLERLRGRAGWEALERELGSGLRRSLGVEPASAFVAALRATEPAQVGVLQTHWEGKWHATLSAMEQEAPEIYALLRRHTEAQIARVRGTPSREQRAPRQRVGGDPADGDPVRKAEKADGFAAHLLDESGEVGSDLLTDPAAFARAYRNALAAAPDAEAREELARRNAEALARARQAPAARAVLDGGESEESAGRKGRRGSRAD